MSTTTAQPGIGFIGLADQGLPTAAAAEAVLPLAHVGANRGNEAREPVYQASSHRRRPDARSIRLP
ncbi:hypothetical protein [Micromonospora coerulea]|uniref:hypothetical protein n=1 Tax=Micromonospora coerulea TaxID=47856 RepID=UPI0031F89B18